MPKLLVALARGELDVLRRALAEAAPEPIVAGGVPPRSAAWRATRWWTSRAGRSRVGPSPISPGQPSSAGVTAEEYLASGQRWHPDCSSVRPGKSPMVHGIFPSCGALRRNDVRCFRLRTRFTDIHPIRGNFLTPALRAPPHRLAPEGSAGKRVPGTARDGRYQAGSVSGAVAQGVMRAVRATQRERSTCQKPGGCAHLVPSPAGPR